MSAQVNTRKAVDTERAQALWAIAICSGIEYLHRIFGFSSHCFYTLFKAKRSDAAPIIGKQWTTAGRSILVNVYEMSIAGCIIASRDGALLEAGASITLTLRAAGPVEGQLIWAEGHVARVQFTVILEDAVVRALRPQRPADADTTFRDRFGRPLAALKRRFTARSLEGHEPTGA